MKQEAFILYFAGESYTNLSTLNSKLSEGYQVFSVTPMSGTGETGVERQENKFPFSRAVVILGKVDPSSPGTVGNFQPLNPLQ